MINDIIEKAVESAVSQQAYADYEYYDPLLPDPGEVPVISAPEFDFYEEKDDYGVDFFDLNGDRLESDVIDSTSVVAEEEVATE